MGRTLVYVAGHKEHISLHPVPRGDGALTRELAIFKAGAGTLRFKLNERVPYALIAKVIRQLRGQDTARAAAKGMRRSPTVSRQSIAGDDS